MSRVLFEVTLAGSVTRWQMALRERKIIIYCDVAISGGQLASTYLHSSQVKNYSPKYTEQETRSAPSLKASMCERCSSSRLRVALRIVLVLFSELFFIGSKQRQQRLRAPRWRSSPPSRAG